MNTKTKTGKTRSQKKVKPQKKPEMTALTQGDLRILGGVAKRFRITWEKAVRGDIIGKYGVAEEARIAHEEYGHEGIQALALAINRSDSYVYSYLAVLKTWNPGERRHLLAEAKGRIEWSHLILLSNKQIDAEKRKSLLKLIISKGISPTELKHMLYPKSAPTSLDSADEVVVGDGPLAAIDDASQTELETTATDNKGSVPNDDDADRDETRELDDGSDASGQPATTKPATFSTCVRALRTFTSQFGVMAGQAELFNHQLLAGLAKAKGDELTGALDDLASNKTAAEKLALAWQAHIKELDVAMTTIQSAIAKNGDQVDLKVDADVANASSLQLLPSGTVASVQHAAPPLASADLVRSAGRRARN